MTPVSPHAPDSQSGPLGPSLRPSPGLSGPGMGAAAYHPHLDRVIFIHGLFKYSAEKPYGITRRFGAILDIANKQMQPMESRSVHKPVPLSILSGGTHAHSWSPDGKRVSFTYDDALDEGSNRTVGWAEFLTSDGTMDSHSNEPVDSSCKSIPSNLDGLQSSSGDLFSDLFGGFESFRGAAPCFLLARCSEDGPLLQGVEECWVGNDRIAFLGKIRSVVSGVERFEIFIGNLPDRRRIEEWNAGERCAKSNRSAVWAEMLPPCVPSSLFAGAPEATELEASYNLQPLTDFEGGVHAGIQGPRHWLVADRDGEWVYFIRKDDQGVVQLMRVHSRSRIVEQLTRLNSSIEGQIAVAPCGTKVAFVKDERIHVWNAPTGELWQIDEQKFLDLPGNAISRNRLVGTYVGAPHFIDGASWLINRYVLVEGTPFLQIIKVSLDS